jgi:hypothetical protein
MRKAMLPDRVETALEVPSPTGISLEVFDRVPIWAIVHAAADNSTAPLIREGEVAVVESDGRTGFIPKDGGLYLIEWVGPPTNAFGSREWRTRAIMQARKSDKGVWWASPYARTFRGKRVFVCSDGPYRDEFAMADKLLGPVVGIYRPQLS